MAEVVGYLNVDQATYGEKEVLKRLEQGLPKEFTVYVECPIGHGDMPRFPDFIIVTNFGVVVIEVKDWVTILEFDKFHVKISQRGGKDKGGG